MKHYLLTSFAMLLALSARSTELSGFYWLLTPSGNATVGKNSIVGTKFSMEKDLGYTDEIGTAGGTVLLGDVIQFGVTIFGAEADASKVITRDIQFRDLNFSASSRMTSEFDATIGRAFLRLSSPTDGFHIGAEAGLLYAGLSASARASGIGSAEAEADAGMPYAGLHLSLNPVDAFSIHAEGRLSKWEISDYEVEYVDIEVSARLHLNVLFLGGGYRNMAIQVIDEPDNIDVDLEFSGPILYAGFEW